MNRISRKALRAAPHFLALVLASPALAQTVDSGLPALPEHSSVDERGVNVTDGSVQIADPQLSIGTETNGIKYNRYWPGAWGWRDNYTISLQTDSSSHVTVIIGAESKGFSGSSGSYSSDQSDGSSLSEDSASFTYTARDGTTVYLDKSLGLYLNAAYGTVITKPTGMKTYLTYKTGSYGVYIGDGYSIVLPAERLQSVRTSTGFQLKYTYASNTLSDSTASAWLTVSNVRAINAANDYCDPNADTCSSFSQSWPTVTYSTSASGTDTIESVTDPTGRVRQYVTNNSGQLTGIRRPSSPSSNSKTYSYDTNGFVSSVAVSAVGTWNYTFTPGSGTMNASITTPTIPVSRYVTSSTAYQQATSVTDENGYTTQYAYYSNGRIQTITLPEGNSVTYGYDGRGNMTSTVSTPKSGSGLGTIATYASYPSTCTNPNTCNQPISTTDAAGNVTNYYYNSNGTPDYIQLPAPSSGAARPETHFTYWTGQAWLKWSSGSVTLAPDPITWLWKTDTCITGSWPCASSAERETEIGYVGGPSPTNMLINGLTVRRGDNAVSTSTGIGYDAFGNVTSRTDPLGRVTTFGYYADRQLDYMSSPSVDGSSTGYKRAMVLHYDTNGQIDSQTWATTNWDGSGYTPLLYRFPEYDGAGRQVAEREATGAGSVYAIKQWSYNGAARLDCETLRMNPADFASRPATCTQGTGGADRITHYIWEYAGLLDRAQSGYGTALQRDEVHYVHTLNGKTSSMTDAKGNVTSYAYDGHDQMLRECYNASATSCQSGTATDFVQLTYDSAGRVTNRGLRGHSTAITIGYIYDNLGRLTNANYPGGGFYDAPVSYSYDNLGEMLSANDTNTHSMTFGYDALGRVTSEGDSVSTRTMQYDAAGRRTQLSWPDSRYVTYQYDAVGEMTGILENGSSTLATFAYDGLGHRTSLTRGNGVVTYYDYDASGRLSCLRNDLAGGGTLNCSPTASGQDQATTFAYNVAGQIVSRTAANDAYAWDGSRNFNYNYTTNALNQYTAVGTNTLTYDVKANLANDGGPATYYTSTKNELVWKSDTSTGFYHNPLGQLDDVIGGGYGFSYVGNQITEERTDSSPFTILRRYVYGPNPDEPIVWYEGSDFANKRYLVADERGSIIAVTNSSGAAITINSYDEYGKPGTSNDGRFQYTGQAWIPQLGLYSFKSRIYSPSYGRFLQTDSAGYPDGPNWYNYAKGDPVNNTDPLGTDCFSDAAACPDFPISVFGDPCAAYVGSCSSIDPNSIPPGYSFNDPSGGSSFGGGSGETPPATDEPKKDDIVVTAYKPPKYNLNDPKFHHYDFINSICNTSESGCTVQDVYDALKYFAAPGMPGEAFNGRRSYIPGIGHIIQFLDEGRFTVYNVTTGDHEFSPGWVERTVISVNGGVSIETIGEGTGNNRLLNLITAQPAFTILDALVRSTIITPPTPY